MEGNMPLVADESVFLLGKVLPNSVTNFETRLTNTTDSPIMTVPFAGCGCTTPRIEPQLIPAKGTAKLLVAFDSSGKSGVQEKKFGVNYNYNGAAYGLSLTLKAII